MVTSATVSDGRRFISFIVFIGLSLSSWTAYPQSPERQRTDDRQRPRRVATAESDSSSITRATTYETEDVGEGDVIRVDTQLVSIPAAVTDINGRPWSKLRADNFEVFEDGQKQTVANFYATNAPFEIALLLDTSASTQEDLALITRAARAFIEALHPEDRVAVVAFNNSNQEGNAAARVEVLTELTADQQTLQTAIQNIGSSRGTPLYDALDQIIDLFRQPQPREKVRSRQAIVALTDGVDSSSNVEISEIRAKILGSGLACYFIQVNTEDFVEDRLLKDCSDSDHLSLSVKQLQRYRRTFLPGAPAEDYERFCQLGSFERMDISRHLYNLARWEMNDLAKTTGGANFYAANLLDARAAFAEVAAQLGTQYSLGYYPSNKTRDGKFRLIRVELRGVEGQPHVRAREGYYAPSM
jgi:VWFA-related protein